MAPPGKPSVLIPFEAPSRMAEQNELMATRGKANARSGPGRGWYALAAVLFLIAIASLALEGRAIARNLGTAVYFLAPGSKVIEVSSPGTYTIWHENRILFNGTTYSSVAGLPGGVTFTVTGPRGEVAAVTPSGGATVTSGSNESHSLATFEAPVSGNYTLTVSGLSDPHVISVTRSNFGELLGTIMICTLLQIVGIPGAIIITCVVAFLRYRARQETAAVNAAK